MLLGSRQLLKGPDWGLQAGNTKNVVAIPLGYKDPGRYVPIMFLLYSWSCVCKGPYPVSKAVVAEVTWVPKSI